MAEATQAIELIRRIIADDTADLRERVQHVEQRLNHEGVRAIGGDDQQPAFQSYEGREDGGDPPPQAEQLRELLHRHKELEQRLEAIKAIHKLDATPVQWTRSNNGKMVEAPDNMWEISCLACNHQVVWQEGQASAPQCKTWRIANGEEVQ